MSWGRYLGIGLLACVLYGCNVKSKPRIPLETSVQAAAPCKVIAAPGEFCIDNLDYISQDDINRVFSQLEKELKKHGQELKKAKLRICDERPSGRNIRFCTIADHRTNTIDIYKANIDDMARNMFQIFLEERNELERILDNPSVLEEYLGNEAEFFMKLKHALFYKALGPVDENEPEEFYRLYSKVCFLDFFIGNVASLNDGMSEKEDRLYESVFRTHSNARARLFSGLVLNSFEKNWSYFAIGRAFDGMYLEYNDSHRNYGWKIIEMFINMMATRGDIFEPVGIDYSKFDKKNPKSLMIQIPKIPPNLFRICLNSHLKHYYHKRPLKENMPELIEDAKTYLRSEGLIE
jgi:hypothetical protein